MRRGRILAALTFVILTVGASRAGADELKEVSVGYGYTVPASLILKEQGLLEQALAPRGITVKWVLSLGSNKTLEFLRSKSIDFGPSSNASAFLGRANGTPIKLIYWIERKDGAPILVRKDSSFQSFADLKGKKIAATPGTGPYIGLIAALQKFGLTKEDVQIVALQHPDGRVALAAGRVDGWAGLEPDWSIAELRNNARVLYIDDTLPGGGVFSVREEFAKAHPDITEIVVKNLDRARRYSLEHSDEAVKLFADGSHLDLDVAKSAFFRSDTTHPVVVPADADGLIVWGKLFKTIGAIADDTDIEKVARDTLDPSFSQALVNSQ
jgi:sulfonate transport system substrate-binding protein